MTRSQKHKSKRKLKSRKLAPLVLPELRAERSGNKMKVTAWHEGQFVFWATIDPDSDTQRQRFLKGLSRQLPNLECAALEARLLEQLKTLPPEEPASQPGVESAPQPEPESESPPVRVRITYRPDQNGKGLATAELDGNAESAPELVHMDNALDPCKANHRAHFIKALAKKVLDLDEADTENQLLDIAQREDRRLTEQKQRQLNSAPPYSKGENKSSEELLASMPQDIRDEAVAMLNDPNLVQRIADDIATLDVAGERELTVAIYLAGVSRHLDRPIAEIIQGPSSSGKSYLIDKTTSLLPPEVLIHATQMTPQALFHMRPGALVHKFIVAGERSRLEDDDRAEATRALREMLSAGKLSKLMPMRVEGNQIETRLIEQDGPIAYIESTTLTKVDEEDANRCIMLHTDERPEQTRRIIRQLAASYSQRNGSGMKERIIQRHHAFQRMLKPKAVIIPFANRVGELLASDSVQARRAYPHLMSMVQASVVLHQRQRQQDGDGRLIAIADDYELARHLLLKPMMKQLGGGLSDPARRFFERLQKRLSGTFTSSEAKKDETGSKTAVYGWLHELHEAGFLEQVEARRGSAPAKWEFTAKTPDDASTTILPPVSEVFAEKERLAGSTWNNGHKPQLIEAQ
jgi:hypothetical protein